MFYELKRDFFPVILKGKSDKNKNTESYRKQDLLKEKHEWDQP